MNNIDNMDKMIIIENMDKMVKAYSWDGSKSPIKSCLMVLSQINDGA